MLTYPGNELHIADVIPDYFEDTEPVICPITSCLLLNSECNGNLIS